LNVSAVGDGSGGVKSGGCDVRGAPIRGLASDADGVSDIPIEVDAGMLGVATATFSGRLSGERDIVWTCAEGRFLRFMKTPASRRTSAPRKK